MPPQSQAGADLTGAAGPVDVLGEPGMGFKIAMEILNSGRVGLAGGAVGGSKQALKVILDYVTERQQFNKYLYEFELIKEKIATMGDNEVFSKADGFLEGILQSGIIIPQGIPLFSILSIRELFLFINLMNLTSLAPFNTSVGFF